MLRAVIDLVLPVSCGSCGAPGRGACDICVADLRRPARLCWPTPAPAGMPPPYAVARYQGATRALLLAYKERGLFALDRPLGDAVAASARAVAVAARRSDLLLVPVPSSRRATSERGEDVVARLARRAVPGLCSAGLSASVLPALRHHRRVADSAGLGAAARADNLRGAFRLRRRSLDALAGRPLVLVDDLVTTGATLTECAGVLREVGAQVIGAATVAATARRHTPAPREADGGSADRRPG